MQSEDIKISISRDMLIKELYNLRAYIEPENEKAKQLLSDIVDLVIRAPLNEQTSNYPRTRSQNR